MKSNRLFIFLIFVMGVFGMPVADAQITSDAQNGYIMVHSYNGSTTQNAFGYHIRIYDKNVDIRNWSLMVAVNGPIRNGEGKILDPSKLRIRINNIVGEGPTMEQIGTNNTPVPLSHSNVPIFLNSKAPITTGPNNSYKTFSFFFDIITEGGAYLEALKSWQEYDLNVVFSLRTSQNQLITESPASVRMQIYPQGAPPSGPTYSIQVNGNANDGVLEFGSISDYVNGVSQTYNNGLSITSTTNYQVQVRTLAPNFQGSSSTIPVNAVRLNLKQVNQNNEGTITLSESPQTVISNGAVTGSQAALYNLRYFTQPNDARLFNAKSDTYRATLMYTLVPK